MMMSECISVLVRYAVPHKTGLAFLVLGMPDSKDDWRSLNRRSSGERFVF